MQEIYITDKQYNKATPLTIDGINVESTIMEVNIQGKIKIYKEFLFDEDDLLENKVYTIKKLNEHSDVLPEGFVIPDTIVHHGLNLGISYEKIYGRSLETILNNPSIDAKEKIYYLRMIGKLLKDLGNMRKYSRLKNFYINDLHEGNFIIDKEGKLKTIDLDSSKICDNLTFGAKYLSIYSFAHVAKGKYKIRQDGRYSIIVPDEQTDLHCYNMMILSFLYGDIADKMNINEFYDFLDYLGNNGINKELIDSFHSLSCNKPNINPEELLPSLSYDQIGKARVYRLLKKGD